MKALLYTSDPYEPSGVIGLFETEAQKQAILQGYRDDCLQEFPSLYGPHELGALEDQIAKLKEIDIPIGVYGEYY